MLGATHHPQPWVASSRAASLLPSASQAEAEGEGGVPFWSLASDSPWVELGPEWAGTPQTPFRGEHGEVSFLHHVGLLTSPCSSRDSGSFRSFSAQRMGRHLSNVEGLMVLGEPRAVLDCGCQWGPCLGFSPRALLLFFFSVPMTPLTS